ncbi:hypothetical protein KOI35_09960 [Actinoplanes bogorensis]|uniref:Uncharacterized protein n=1 Tax=Paractinoplanes bogorensis TaxID=1610840 RepID=A0ABS5YK94_9ACTN|nr:DUF6069 family protein [Actinoplanes bogorensis]MBU2663832.1 hypothetical protein [Actinoplanes bogorensis]
MSNDVKTSRGVTGQRLVTILVAAAATAVVWVIVHLVFGVELSAQSGGTVQTVGLVAVILATLVAGFVAWGLLVLLQRFTKAPARNFLIVSAIGLLLSLGGPAGGETTGAKVGLAVLHLVAALVLVPGLARTAEKP